MVVTAHVAPSRVAPPAGTLRVVWGFAALGGLAQSLAGAAGGLLARHVGGSDLAGGLPQAMLVLGAGGAALGLSEVASRRGRAVSLSLGCLVGALGCAVVALGGLSDSLAAILLGSGLVGAGTASVMLARYAATELDPGRASARSIASVLAATTIGAVVGPNLLAPSAAVAGHVQVPSLVGAYVVAGAVFLVAAGLIARTRGVLPAVTCSAPHAATVGTDIEVRHNPTGIPDGAVGAAVLCVANLVMVAVMTMAPLHLRHDGAGLGVIGLVVSVHIAGMFAPSPLSGRLAELAGSRATATAALVVLVGACLWASLAEPDALQLGGAMLLLGIGWNVALVAGSDLLTRAVQVGDRPRRESLGELGMGIAAAAGGAGSGVLMVFFGYSTMALVIGVIPGVLLVALVWGARAPGHETSAAAGSGSCRHGHALSVGQARR